MNYKQQLSRFYRNQMKESEVFKLGMTPDFLRENGMPALSMQMTQRVARKVTQPGGEGVVGHGISRQIMKDIKRQLENPVMIIGNPGKNAYVIVTDKNDYQGNPVIIAIHCNRKFERKRVNEIKSIYGRHNFEKYIKREKMKGNVIYMDEKKADGLRQSGGLQLPKEDATIVHENNIPCAGTDVNGKFEKTLPMAGWSYYSRSLGE